MDNVLDPAALGGGAALQAAPRIRLECECSPVLNFAMEQNGVPLIREIAVINEGTAALQGARLEITVEPNLSELLRLDLPEVPPGGHVARHAVEVPLVPGRLREVTEAEVATVRVRALRGDELLSEHRANLRVLAFNEWPGSAAPTPLLTAFVLPNHPVVSALLQSVREELRNASLPDGLDGYQTADPARARDLTAALYRAIQALGIGYVGLPASFEQSGQKVRLPDAVLADRLGGCLDLSVLFAAALEQMGLAPLVFLVKGHAFAGVWLRDERFPEGLVEDAARLRTLIQLGQVLPFEATAVTAAEHPAFETAARLGLERLVDDDAFRCALDVRVLRTEYRPIPVRTVRAPGDEGLETGAAAVTHALAAKVLARAAALPPPVEAPPSPPPTDVAQRFRRWKDRLLDLTLRNRLLNFKLSAKGTCQLAVPDVERLEDGVFTGRPFALMPRPEVDAQDERDPALAEKRVLDVAEQRRREDLARFVLHTRHGADDLWTRLTHLDREARTALEEGGASTLYLAIGLLRWFETPSSPDAILAPLLLYPVELRRDLKLHRYSLRRLPEEPVLNVTLLEKLRRDHGVDVSTLSALPLEGVRDGVDAGVDVTGLLTRFREAIQRLPRWEVLEEAHLGLFSFTKFLMWKDLDENADRFMENAVVRRIASREITPLEQKPLVQPEQVDGWHPADLPTVLDADSTQAAAIASSLEGQSFVLQGPPGTGKSQTIANLVAANVARGRSVLFVSEKMAALEVVHRRLRDVGLADFCLELHSHKANKKDVVESLRAALTHARGAPADGWREHGDRLLEARRQTDRYVEALHAPRASGSSVYQLRDRLQALHGAPDVPVRREVVSGLDAERLRGLRHQVDELAGMAAGVEPVEAHPFRQSGRTEWSAEIEDQLRAALGAAQEAARGWERARARLAQTSSPGARTSAGAEDLAVLASTADLECACAPGLDPSWPRNAERLRTCVEARRVAEARRAELAQQWSPRLLELDPQPLLPRFERWASAFFLVAWVMLWGARRRLRPHARGQLPANAAILADLRTLAALREGADALRAETAWAGELLGTGEAATVDRWLEMIHRLDAAHAAVIRIQRGASCDDATLRAISTVPDPLQRTRLVEAARGALDAAAALHAAEAELRNVLVVAPDALPPWSGEEHPRDLLQLLSTWTDGLRRLRGWCLYRAASAALGTAGFPELPAAHQRGELPARLLGEAFEKAVLSAAHATAVDGDPELRDFDPGRHSKRVAHFVELDRGHVMASRRHVVSSLEARLPSMSAAEIESSEPALIMREAQKKTRHLPVRRLLQQLPSMLPRLKPCLLMSPMSVAQYLPADAPLLDLVVFDEASQIATHDAIGAIARGRQVIVVGDSRQMPPTSFFTRTDEDEEVPNENDVVELESVLEEAVARLVPQQWLGWHYRSRHESLIDFSNRNIYEGRLDVFPAAQFESEDVGVHWRRVADGVYQPGGGKEGRTNRKEAEALVAYLVERFRSTAPEERTFGVVTFNVPQQMLVMDLLDEERADPLVDRHFTSDEPVFVKNLENVQGDERDEIAFSICSAPEASGRFSVAVGALNVAGGERRLNVAITRARRKLIVFSSIEPETINRSSSKAKGIWLLRDFLLFARDGRKKRASGDAAAGPVGNLEGAMADVLRQRGLHVDTGVGCSGYRLDLALRDPSSPGRYAMAIESDGPAYRKARSARDRDRLRSQVLSSMGWRLHRVWSSGWWYDDQGPAALAQQVELAMKETPTPERFASSLHAAAGAASASPVTAHVVVEPRTSSRRPSSRYVVTTLPGGGGDSEAFYLPSAAPLVRQQIAAVLAAEGPVHVKVLARRIGDHWGIGRLTANPMRRIADQLASLRGSVIERGGFLWPSTLDPNAYRDFRACEDGEPPRELPQIAPEELANAAEAILRDAGSLERDVLAREVARVFGVQRMGANVREAVDGGVEVLLATSRAVDREGRIALVEA